MAAIHSNKMMTTCRRPHDQLTRQPSNLSTYEGYHGNETASVPFTWESQPGTPKLKFRETSLPPLAPPPSYSYAASPSPNHPRSILKAHNKKNSSSSTSNSNLLQSIFPKRAARKARAPPPRASSSAIWSPPLSYSSSSSSSSSSYKSWQRSRSVPSTPTRCPRKEKENEEDLYDVPVSGACFGNAGFRGCYSSLIKKVMLGDFL